VDVSRVVHQLAVIMLPPHTNLGALTERRDRAEDGARPPPVGCMHGLGGARAGMRSALTAPVVHRVKPY